MLTIAQKYASILLSFVLVVSLCPLVAYAQPSEEQAGVSNAVLSEVEESPVAIEEQAEDTIEFVYVESATLEVGAAQNVAVGLANESAVITAATLTVEDENGETATIEAANVVDNAALFTWEPVETGLVTVQGMEYMLEGAEEPALATFENINDEGAYSFDVVSGQLMQALEAETTEEGITALVMEDDGSFTPVESVDEALELADENIEEEMVAEEGDFISDVLGIRDAYADPIASTRENYLVVAIDPGHGGSDNGASATYYKDSKGNYSTKQDNTYTTKVTLFEKNQTLFIAQAMQAELKKYTGVTPYMTRTSDTYVGLETRVNRAAARGADVFVSIHINSADSTSAKGVEIWYPNGSSYHKSTHSTGEALSQKILNQLLKLGLTNRGIKMRTSDSNKYPDGSPRDYYSIIRNSRAKNIPGIIVEHAFISNKDDAKTLSSSANLTKMGQADAAGVIQQYSLGLNSAAKNKSLVAVTARVKTLGWESTVYDKKVAGTVGHSLPLNAFKVQLTNAVAKAGGIQYSVNGGAWKSNGAVAGTDSDSGSMTYIQMKLTGGAANSYDIYYRVHASTLGWLGWAKNGAKAGSSGYGYKLQALEVVVVKKGAAAPGSTSNAFAQPKLLYRTHVQNVGWQDGRYDGATSGTTGKSLRLEGIKISLPGKDYSGSIQYKTHVQNIGWQGWVKDGALAGTTGRKLRLEAIQIKLTGEMANQYDVYYRVHSQNFGWMGWAKNGASAGTAGYSYRLEAIQIKLVKKGGKAPGSTASAFRQKKK